MIFVVQIQIVRNIPKQSARAGFFDFDEQLNGDRRIRSAYEAVEYCKANQSSDEALCLMEDVSLLDRCFKWQNFCGGRENVSGNIDFCTDNIQISFIILKIHVGKFPRGLTVLEPLQSV